MEHSLGRDFGVDDASCKQDARGERRSRALQREELPEDAALREDRPKAGALADGLDLAGLMEEDAEPEAEHGLYDVRSPQPCAYPPAIGREREQKPAPGALGGWPNEAGHVGIAADDLVDDHDVRGCDGLSDRREISDDAFDAVRDTELVREVAGIALVVRRDFDVVRMRRAGAEEVDLHRADTAADLQHGGAGDTASLEHLAPYMRGVNFALEAISGRFAEDNRLQNEVAIYRAIAQDYMKHGLATLKLRGA